MQNNTDNKSDAFSDIFRHKLENHQLPVDADCWTEIENRLKSKKRRIIPFWFWISGGAAVAALALLFTLHPLSESPDLIGKSKPANIQQKNTRTEAVAKQETQNTNLNKKTNIISVIAKQTSNNQENSTTNENVLYSHTNTNDTAENNTVIENAIVNKSGSKEVLAQETTKDKDTIAQKKTTRILSDNLIAKTNDEPTPKPKKKQNWLLAAAFGTGGSMDINGRNGSLYSTNGYSGLANASSDYTNILSQNDFTQKNYLPPISFGLIIRKNLDKTLSLESGLVYTYLLSTFENFGVQHSDAKLHLHYIGIPLNLIGKLWENPKWELYLSGGTMVEKGIQSVYIQNQYSGNQSVLTTTAKTNINGLQWSVNGAIGITYKVQRNWGIYFEPKCSYFFDNNQPVSARTEHPVIMGLTAGVRFQFK